MSELLKSYIPQKDNMPFYVSLAGVTYPDCGYRITRAKSDLLVIEYIINGQGYVLVNNDIKKVTAGQVYVCQYGAKHYYFSDKKDPYTKIFLNVRGNFAKDLATAYGIENEWIFSIPEIEMVFKRIPRIIESGMSEDDIQSALQGVLGEILARLSFAKGKLGYSPEAIKLRDYIDSNLNVLISAKKLSSLIFRSPDYCQKLFLREFGKTPYAYQLDRKIQNAKSLLVNTKMTVGEIGMALGYSDSHYFSNLFRDKCGCRPTDYRKMHITD